MILFSLLVGLCFSSQDLHLFEAVEPHMGTLVRIQLYALNEDNAKTGFRAAFARIAELDARLSDYRLDSELSRLRAGEWNSVSSDLYKVLRIARKLSVDSDGAFDVTIGALTGVWRSARRTGRIAADGEIAVALRSCGYRHLQLASGRVRLRVDGMKLDVGGIGKGFAAQEAVRALRGLGISRVLVAMSGDLAVGDAPPGREGWSIQIEPGRSRKQVRVLRNCGVSTSGDREQYLEFDGRRYSHILDPRTGRALEQSIGVTVIAKEPVIADGLATAVSVLGADEGRKLAARYHAEVVVE